MIKLLFGLLVVLCFPDIQEASAQCTAPAKTAYGECIEKPFSDAIRRWVAPNAQAAMACMNPTD